MKIELPKLSLVVLIGASGAGKSTFAARHFRPTEVLSSDTCRGWVSDDPNDQTVSADAFEVLELIARKRLAAGRLTVIDATNVQPEGRKKLVALAREYHVLPVAIVLKLGEKICAQRNQTREDRNFGGHVLRRQYNQLKRSLRSLKKEGFRNRFILESQEEIDAVEITRVPLWNDRSDEHGPFDFIGDVHGCYDELELLLKKLGYQPIEIPKEPGWRPLCFQHPEGRKAAFVGDLVDRGPRALDCLSVARNMVQAGTAICVPGNHDVKLLRKLRGKQVKIKHGLAETLEDLETVPDDEKPAFNRSLVQFLDNMVSHYVLDDRKLVVAHAGLPESMHGRGSGTVRSFALYGETTGEIDDYGLPVRLNWAADYRGEAVVVYGHTPVPSAQWLNQTINIDTGCVFGGELTALRYPERELVSVPANRVYYEPAKPLDAERYDGLSSQQIHDDLLDAADVIGTRYIATRLRKSIKVREDNATAALEVMSRFAVDPKWLIYLPPTMSPAEASHLDGFLEHPAEAFAYFRKQGVSKVVCQEKHMGSRAVVIVCRDAQAAVERFGITTGESGIVYTRTGRRFFNDLDQEQAFISRIARSLSEAGFWETHQTNWVCLDCELMPWSAKAQALLRSQYAAVAASATTALPSVVKQLQKAATRLKAKGEDLVDDASVDTLESVLGTMQVTAGNIDRFRTAYRQYCWDVQSLDDYKLAPFHVLATEGQVHVDKPHAWHLDTIAGFAGGGDLLMQTKAREVDLSNDDSVNQATQWWIEMTSAGGEGMVVKPSDFIHHGTSKGQSDLTQPAIKCRGKEYLRIIYGPDYDLAESLQRLRQRSLGRKRSLALREFALGVEALERFVEKEPLRRVHECVFGVLALESEPVDPRL